jgi:hypothetical protein
MDEGASVAERALAMGPLAGLLLFTGTIVVVAGAVVYLLAVSGRTLVAWMIPGGIALFVLGIFVFEEAIHSGEGQTGFALFLILVLFFAPLFAGSLAGCLAGQLVLWTRRKRRGA